MIADVGSGLLPRLNEDVLLAEQLQARFELLRNHASAAEHVDQFRDHLQLSFVRTGGHDRCEVGGDGLDQNFLLAPVPRRILFEPVPAKYFFGIASSGAAFEHW